MSNENKVIQGKMHVAGIMGPVWMMGWLFTLGWLGLSFGKGLLALALWPYYVGAALH